MGRGIFNGMLETIEKAGEKVTDTRRIGFDLKFKLTDAVKSALAVFFFQHPSLLDFQLKMKEQRKRCNLETMLHVQEIPSSVQITTLLDSINLDSLNEVFNENLQKVDKWGSLDEFRCLDGGVLIALDGVWYHSSEKIRCPRCLHTTKGGVTTYYHSTLAGAIVRPGKTAVLDYGYSFIFTCKDTSHPWLAETITNSFLEETSRKEWNGRHHLIYTYQWLNGVQIRDNKETLPVNYLSTSIWNEEQKKRTFYNSWITNKTISTDTAAHLASCARARWKYRERTQQRT